MEKKGLSEALQASFIRLGEMIRRQGSSASSL